ncbi:glycosyltransferase family 4 protein [Xanthobacter pseudotagetidis]|uniref:glycosyltransferase family 4 protein n=1 Tax=Xanthobacter pseudotagetidis TaxID=3119911 RepID=UPI003727CBD1
MSLRAVLAFPGDLDTPTGGYAYDRRMLSEMRALGLDISPLPLGAGFPFPTPDAVETALARLQATTPGTVLLVDGLALGVLPAAGLAALERPIVGLVHHPLALESGLDAPARARLEASERAALARCRAVVVTAPATARTLAADFGVPAATITLAVPGTQDAPRAPGTGDPPRLLAIGSLIPRKGYRVLLDALERLGDLAFSLTVAGSLTLDPAAAEDIRARAERLPAGRVRLLGALPEAQLDRLYQEADIFVHPSLFEGYGMVLAEALKRGLPVVCTTGGAAAETVPDGAGLKVPPGDAAALAEALRAVIADRALRRRLADAAFAAGAALPGWTDGARAIAVALRRVAGEEA